MQKFIFALAVAAFLAIAPAAHARSAQGSDAGFFIGAHAGQAYFNGNGDLHSSSYGLNLGYRWALNRHNSLGFQAGYIRPQTLDYYNGYGRSHLQTKAYTLGATYHLTFGERRSGQHWFFAARVGYMHWQEDENGRSALYNGYNNTVQYGTYAYSETDTGSYAGVGIGFDFNDNVGLGLYYDYYLANLYEDSNGNYSADGVSVPSLGLEIRF